MTGKGHYSKVLPSKNCSIINSGLILLDKTPPYKKLTRLIPAQFLLKLYIHSRILWFILFSMFSKVKLRSA